jgi:hypothetical protein
MEENVTAGTQLPQESNAAEGTPHQLGYRWLWPEEAAQVNPALHRRLWRGCNTYTWEQYCRRVASGEYELLVLPLGTIFLVTWGESNGLKLCQILTICASNIDFRTADIDLPVFETAVRSRGGKVVLSAGRKGYTEIVKRHNWTVDSIILMRKELK